MDRRYVTRRCFVPDSSLRTKATGAEWHALDRICAKAKLARLHGGESILFLAGKRWFSCARTRNPGRDAGISLWNKRMTFKHRQGDQDARTSMVGRKGRKCSQGRACLAGKLLRPVTGGGFGQTGRRRLRRAHVDRFFWCLGGTAVRSPGQSVVPSRNLLGGHFFSALVGVACAQWLPPFWAVCLCVPTAIAVMLLSGTVHPPGGATALIAVTGGEQIRQLGFWYAVVPCLAGAALMLAVAWSMTAAAYLWARLYGRVRVKEGETTGLHILSGR